MVLVALPRAALAGGIFGGALAEGLPRAGVLLAIGAGAVVLALHAANRRPLSFDSLPDAPADAVYGPWWQSVARAALPSTVGLGILGAVALAFSRALAGLCAGLLAGLAILGLVFGILLVLEERKHGARLYVSWSIVAPRRFAGPR
jgi:asparagine N-glycosylation enzyme membrane subunit Stt3